MNPTAPAAAQFNELHDRLAKQIDEAEQRIARQRDDVMAGLEHMASESAATSMPSSPVSRLTRARSAARSRQRSRETADDRHGLGGGRRGGTRRRILSDPAFWVGVAFVLFFALAGKTMWKRVSDILDKRAAAIVKALEDAERLRDEALKAKQEAERTLTQAAAESGAILQQARDEAQRMQARAEANLKTAVALREQQALDRIAQSETAATKQVRDTAVDVALAATRALLREQVGPQRGHDHRGDRRAAAPPALSFPNSELPA